MKRAEEPSSLPTLLRRSIESQLLSLRRKGAVGIALSGGVDSCSVLAAALAVGLRPALLSYTPSTHESTDHAYVRNNAVILDLPFFSVVVDMHPDNLDAMARQVIGLGYRTKMQVESLVPMKCVVEAARVGGMKFLLTGDQADGYYINGNWISRNYDRSQGIPGPQRQHVRLDKDATRIDILRDLYWEEDRANCGAISRLCLEAGGLRAVMPYRHPEVRTAFRGRHWREVNEPRLKETAWQAFPEMQTDGASGIWTRPAPVNLHRGDSNFAATMGAAMLARYPQYKTPLGVYGGIARGEV